MYHTIYIDIVFMTNFLMDYMLLRLVGKFLHLDVKRFRCMISAVFGSFVSCLLLYVPFRIILPVAVLIEHNLRLVVYIAKKFDNTGVGVEDLISIGTIGLIKAINTFNPVKNIKLATYASRCIENEILMYLRRNSKTKMEVSIDEPLNVDWDGNELLLSDILGTDDDVISRKLEDEVEITLLGKAISKLTKREQMIIRLRFGLGNREGLEKTQKEVADLLGISQSYISRLEKRIMKRLRKEIVKYE